MKSFKIKKRTDRIPVFILGTAIGSFPKPNLPLKFIAKTHQIASFDADARNKMLQSAISEPVKNPEIID